MYIPVKELTEKRKQIRDYLLAMLGDPCEPVEITEQEEAWIGDLAWDFVLHQRPELERQGELLEKIKQRRGL